MISLTIDNQFDIRINDSIQLTLHCDLDISMIHNYGLIRSAISGKQIFKLDQQALNENNIQSLRKHRGILIIDRVRYIFEMISTIVVEFDKRSINPIIVRLWSEESFHEYLFSDNIINFRCGCLGMDIPHSTVIMQLAECIGNYYGGGIVYPETMEVIGNGNLPFIIPNISQNQLHELCDKIIIDEYPATTLDHIVQLFFNPIKCDRDILHLTGMLMGKIPYTLRTNIFDRCVRGNHTFCSEIQTIDQYNAFRRLLSIPFEQFELIIHFDEKTRFEIVNAESSFPLSENSKNRLHHECLSFVMNYFKVTCRDNRRHYTLYHEGFEQSIVQLTIIRTIDDFITLHIYTPQSRSIILKFDLVLLSTISPVIDSD